MIKSFKYFSFSYLLHPDIEWLKNKIVYKNVFNTFFFLTMQIIVRWVTIVSNLDITTRFDLCTNQWSHFLNKRYVFFLFFSLSLSSISSYGVCRFSFMKSNQCNRNKSLIQFLDIDNNRSKSITFRYFAYHFPWNVIDNDMDKRRSDFELFLNHLCWRTWDPRLHLFAFKMNIWIALTCLHHSVFDSIEYIITSLDYISSLGDVQEICTLRHLWVISQLENEHLSLWKVEW